MRLAGIRLTDLSPFGPIFGKELRTTARRKRNHLLRVAYLGMLLLFLLLVYTSNSYDGYGGVAYRIQQQNELGREFFAMFSMFCIIAMGLIGPVLTSTAINSERLGKTLPVLLMTPINSWQIVSGKLFSRLLIALMLIGLSLPVLAVVRLLGGVELWQMLAVICCCVAFAVSCAGIGLLYSALVNRAYAVILLSYATILLLYLFAPMLIGMTLSRTVSQWVLMDWVATSNPVFDVALLAIPNGPTTRFHWWPGPVIQLVLAGMLLVASAIIVRRLERRRGQRPIKAQPETAQTLPKTQPPAPDASTPVRIAQSRAIGDNPVLWRETRKPLMKTKWRITSGVAVLLLLIVSYLCFASVRVLDDRDTQIMYALAFTGLHWLLLSVLSATAIAQEKESDTWTTLLVAPLRARAIVLGKLSGILRRMLWPTALMLVHFAIFAIAGVISWIAVWIVLWVTVTFNLLWACVGLYLSLKFAKVTTAVIVNMLIPIALFIGAPLAMQVAGQVLVGRSADWGEVPGLYIPYVYEVSAIDRIRPDSWSSEKVWMPLFEYVTVDEFVFLTLVAGVAHLGLSAAVIGHTIYHFDSIVGRARQLRRNLDSRLTDSAAAIPNV